MKLKMIIRSGVLETNSSSSHSVCISRSEEFCKPGDEAWDLDLREDGTLYIPSPEVYFGRDYFKSNSCLLKLLYAFGLILSRCPERQHELTELVKKVTGAKKVVYEWVEEFNKKVKEQHGLLRDIYVNIPEVDHQSLDLYEEVFENEDTLKEFIFNPKSWLYGGGDESDDPDGFRREWVIETEEDEEALMTIHLGGEIGDVDIPCPNIIVSGPENCQLNSDDRFVGLYTDDSGVLKYLPVVDIWRHYDDFKEVDLAYDRDKLMLVVYPLNKLFLNLNIQRKNPNGFLSVEDILTATGLPLNEVAGIRTYPVSITSKLFGKLC